MSDRIQITSLPRWYNKQFSLWCFCYRKPKGGLAKDIIVSRIDANQKTINEQIQYYAQFYQLEVEELIGKVVELEQKHSYNTIHQELEKGIK